MLDKPTKDQIVTKQFWHLRILSAIATGKDLHQIVYDIDYTRWQEIQEQSYEIICKVIPNRSKILDAGCGYGALLDTRIATAYHYTGIDISDDLIAIGHMRYPDMVKQLKVGDISNIQYPDNTFDWTVCRSIKDMFLLYNGGKEWEAIREELTRVTRYSILCLNYEDVNKYEIIVP